MQKRIMLVDDESSVRRSLSLGLSQEGFDVEPCENGMDALTKLDLLKRNNIDLSTIILDIKLPDIDGIKLGKIIRSKYPEIYLIYITGYADNYNIHEINSQNESSILEKPFTNAELATQVNNIYNSRPVSKEVSEEEKAISTYSAYVLVKLEKSADFFDTYRKLYFMNNVVYCDTTKGEYDIFLLIQSDNEDNFKTICENNISTMEGIKDVQMLNVRKPILSESINEFINISDNIGTNSESEKGRDLSKRVCSYVLLEIEKEKFDKIYPVLRFNDQVVYCDYTTGNYDLVLFVQGSFFNEIDKFIEEKVSVLDGVLRIKEFPVVNLFDM